MKVHIFDLNDNIMLCLTEQKLILSPIPEDRRVYEGDLLQLTCEVKTGSFHFTDAISFHLNDRVKFLEQYDASSSTCKVKGNRLLYYQMTCTERAYYLNITHVQLRDRGLWFCHVVKRPAFIRSPVVYITVLCK